MRRGKKKNVMVYLDPKVVEEARELGLNISKVCENALKEAIRRLKGEPYGKNPGSNPFNNKSVVGSPGFEQGSRTPKSRSLDQASRRPLFSAKSIGFLKY